MFTTLRFLKAIALNSYRIAVDHLGTSGRTIPCTGVRHGPPWEVSRPRVMPYPWRLAPGVSIPLLLSSYR